MNRLGFAISSGAACVSGSVAPSANLLAMGLPESRARTSVRVSLGHASNEHAVRSAAEAFGRAVTAVRRSA
jgi:cysteine desulfurase